MAKKEKPKSYAEQCKIVQNECTKAGTGPNCMDSGANGMIDDGAEQKRECLKEAETSCEKKLEKCLQTCEDGRSKNYQEEMTIWQRSYGSTSAYLVSTTRSPCQQIDVAYGAIDASFHSSGISYALSFTNKQTAFMDCTADCYRQAASDCDTAHCYCDNFKCDSITAKPNGAGAVDDPTESEEQPDYITKYNKINAASLETTSDYGIPIEIVLSRAFMPGNLVWVSAPEEVRNTISTTTFDADTNTYTTTNRTIVKTSVDLIFGVCAGEISGYRRIFINGNEVFDASTGESDDYAVSSGSPASKVLRHHAETNGFGRVPAYRDLATVTIKNFTLQSYKKFPSFTFEAISNSADDPFVVETSAQPGLDTQNIWRVDTEGGIVYYEAVHRVRASSYATLETIRDELTDDAREVTPLGNYITLHGGKYYVYHPYLSTEYGEYTARASNKTFLFPAHTSDGNEYVGLFTFDSSGNLYVEKIDEVRGIITAGPSIVGFDTVTPQCAANAVYRHKGSSPGTTHETSSVFFARVKTGSPATVRVKEVRMVSTDSSARLLEDSLSITYDLPTTAFANTSSLTLKGFVPIKYDNTFLVCASYGSVNRIVKWSPDTGVIWSLDVPSLPDFGRYAQLKATKSKFFAYIAPDDETYRINVATGTYSVVDDPTNTYPGLLDGKQFYDPDTNSITYQSEDSKITRIFLNRKSLENMTLKNAVVDLATRAGMTRNLVGAESAASVEITGFRSGDNTTAAEMLNQLKTVYAFDVFSEEKIDLVMLGTSSATALNEEHFESIPVTSRTITPREDSAVSVEYYDDNKDGETTVQSFFLDRVYSENAVRATPTAYKFTVLETADYMRQLAELIAYKASEDGARKAVTLPPRYLALTVGDAITDQTNRRITSVKIGGNSFVEIESVTETASIYQDVIALSGADTPTNRIVPTYQDFMSGPMVFTARGVQQVYRARPHAYVGAANTYGELGDVAVVTPTAKSFGVTPSGTVSRLTSGIIWGKLTVAPPTLTTAFFRTYPSDFYKVKFPHLEFVQRILNKTSHYGEFPDYRTVDPTYNTMVVGYEIIQYGVATQDPLDPYTVVFTNLLRARNNTEDNVAHSVDEFCAVIDQSVLNAPVASATTASKYMTLNRAYARHGGADVRAQDAKPLKPYVISRKDWATPTFTSSAHPGNPSVAIIVDHREENADGFSDSVVNLADVSAGARQMEVYLLRAAYDPILFDAHRTGTATTYIMVRDKTTARTAFTDDENNPFNNAFVWEASSQDTWNWATEPLVAVIIDVNAFGESRAIASWNPKGVFTNRPHRGLSN